MGIVVVVGAYKGGVAKSMTAVNLAAMLAVNGREVMLVDTDRQESAYGWAQVRERNSSLPPVHATKRTGSIWSGLMADRAKWDVVLVDAGGQDSPELRQAIAACDVLLVPVKPAIFDTWAMARVAEAIKSTRNEGRQFRAVSVIAAADTRTKEARELQPILTAEYGDVMPPLDVVLYERVAYRMALREGKGIADGTDDAKALDELTQVYRSVFHD